MKIEFENPLAKRRRSSEGKSQSKKSIQKKPTQIVPQISILNPELRTEYLNYLAARKPVDNFSKLNERISKKSFDSDIELLLSSSNEQDNFLNRNFNPRSYTDQMNRNNEHSINQNKQNFILDKKYHQPSVVEINENEKITNLLNRENSIENSRESNKINSRSKLSSKSNYSIEKDKISKDQKVSIDSIKNEYLETNKSIFNDHNIPETTRREVDDIDILKVLEDKENTVREILYNMPNYFFKLKQEFINTKNTLGKVTNDYFEQSKVNEELTTKINSLIEEAKEKKEKLLHLITENESYRNKQKVLELFKEETQGYIEILKKDNEDKQNEIEIIYRENTEHKINETKSLYERDLFIREKREMERKFQKLEQQKELIREELGCLKRFVESTVETVAKSGIFEKIKILEREKNEMIKYFYMYSENSSRMRIVYSDLSIFIEQLKRAITLNQRYLKNREEEIEILKNTVREIKNKNQILCDCLIKVRKENQETLENIKQLKHQIENVKEIIQQDRNKKQLIETINSQRMELETQRNFYEKKIKELTEKLEEQEDIWDVFE